MSSAPQQQSEPVLILTRADVRRLLTMEECIAAVEEAFRLYGQRATAPPGVMATHVAGGGFHLKAGAMPLHGRLFYAAKANANFAANPVKHGLPTIQGVVLLFDAECGRPLAIMDSIEITSLRTGAATAVAAKHLARRNSQTLTLIGCGMQSSYQLDAVLAVLPIQTIFVHDLDSMRAQSFAASVEKRCKIHTQAVADFAGAAGESDVIVTCTTSRAPFLLPQHVRPGTFVAAVGADNEDKQELDPRLLAGNRLVPDVVDQAATIGELHHAMAAGLLARDSIAADLGQVAAGRQPGRTCDEEIIIFDSTGMALQDVAAACAVYRKAKAESGVTRIALNA
jgi:alanine dehydrogenase